ncbi:MAG: signal peptidase I [Lachnospiraceae bacterium]|nr:signal peptidase I [Lachnospiraceae bacterium]
MEKKKTGLKDVLSVMIDFITTFITTVVVIVAVAFVAVRLLGWEMYSVDSYSMTPAYPIDSLIIVQTVDASEIEVGDVITYVLNEEGTLVTHRVVSIDTSASTFTTKGDANESNDASPVRWENVVGKVVLGIPFLGKPLRYLTAEENRTAVIAVIVGLLAISFLWDRISAVRRKGKEKKITKEVGEEVRGEEIKEIEVD